MSEIGPSMPPSMMRRTHHRLADDVMGPQMPAPAPSAGNTHTLYDWLIG